MAANACPVCNTPLSETRYTEIQEQIRAEERARYEQSRSEFEKEAQIRLDAEIRHAEAQAKETEKGLVAQFSLERERLNAQVAELHARERQQFRSAEALCERLQQIDTDEYSAHQRVWECRGKAQKQLERLLRDINSSMLAIIESEEQPLEARQIVDLGAMSSDLGTRHQRL